MTIGLGHWWKTPLFDNSASMSMVKDDLYTLKQKCEHLHLMLGQPILLGGTDFPDVWSAVEYLNSIWNQAPVHGNTLTAEISELKTLVDAIPSVMNQYVLIEDFHSAMDVCDLPTIR